MLLFVYEAVQDRYEVFSYRISTVDNLVDYFLIGANKGQEPATPLQKDTDATDFIFYSKERKRLFKIKLYNRIFVCAFNRCENADHQND